MTPVTKTARQARIAAILAREQVRSQEELADLLERYARMHVTQATLSRDLDELGVVRLRAAGGGLVYALPEEPGGPGSRPGGLSGIVPDRDIPLYAGNPRGTLGGDPGDGGGAARAGGQGRPPGRRQPSPHPSPGWRATWASCWPRPKRAPTWWSSGHRPVPRSSSPRPSTMRRCRRSSAPWPATTPC